MGAFHAGHASLFAAARAECDAVVVSLFVNPAQFGEEADLLAYPRDEEHDLAIAADAGVDLAFCPSASEMYPAGFQTWVDVSELGSILEGVHRPGHFRGVATICLKLFNIVNPNLVYYGQKDAQQVEVIRRLVRDLDLEIDPRVLPTVRDADGLALSSRNALLTPDERTSPRPAARTRHEGRAARTRRARRRRGRLCRGAPFIRPSSPPPCASAPSVSSTTSHWRRLMSTRPRKPAPATPAPGKLPLTELAEMKQRRQKIVMVTAYDAPSGRLADEAGMDIVLVGDSAAMTVLGHSSTVPATMDEMIVLARAVTRGARRPLVVADMPFGSFQVSDETAVENAVRFVKEAGADAVKIEGAGPMLSRAKALVGAGIPVMGHIGLTPQSATMLGGFKAQGRSAKQARQLFEDARRSRKPAASRSCSSACRRRWRSASPARCTSPRSASAPASSATARCSSGTTCSACTRAGLRVSSSATPTWPRRP